MFRSTLDRPYSEPHRRWDFEKCDYCGSAMRLEQDQCDHCGVTRPEPHRRLRNEEQAWRQPPQGQAAYQDLEKGLERDRRGMAILGGLIMAFQVLVVFTLIGQLFFDMLSLGLWAAAITFVLARWRILIFR